MTCREMRAEKIPEKILNDLEFYGKYLEHYPGQNTKPQKYLDSGKLIVPLILERKFF